MPRVMEAGLAMAGLVLASPLLAVSALLVRLSSPGPVIFRQVRVGRGGGLFTMIKLRTMRISGGGAGITASGDSRVTRVGRLLRRLKLDELPELWNVVRGDLSLVGYRPEVPSYVDPESSLWQQVLQERPGITHPVTLRLLDEEGLIAEAGGDAECFYLNELLPFKLEGYVEYQRRRTMGTDLSVLVATAAALVGWRWYSAAELAEVREARGGSG